VEQELDFLDDPMAEQEKGGVSVFAGAGKVASAFQHDPGIPTTTRQLPQSGGTLFLC
jgi:hypothetical protein